MNYKRVFLIGCLYVIVLCNSNAQVQSPQSPHLSSFQPVNRGTTQSYQPMYQPRQQVRSNDVMRDIIQQNNGFISQAIVQKQSELQVMLREIQQEQGKYATDVNVDRHDPVENAKAMKGFYFSLQRLQDMLSGKLKSSVADAYYTIESAYGKPYLTRQQFNDVIKQSVDFIKTWMQQNNLDVKDNYLVHYAIQKFMSERLIVTKKMIVKDRGAQVQTIAHEPFSYDYDDYAYIKDYHNAFLSKCLATGFGQCNSMPAVYLVLAEGLGAKAYLSFAPNHSFIKFPDNSGYISNYEPTSNWQISDNWYEDNMFISAEAIRSGIYLDTLNYRQVVANCIFDLATEYMRFDRSLNNDFVIACLKAGIQYFPKNNNLSSLFIYSAYLKTRLGK